MLTVSDGRICAPMPALVFRIGVDTGFYPAWKLPGATVSDGSVCFPAPEKPTIVRVGRGWGRRGGDEYYLVESGGARKLRRRAVRMLGGRGWMVCVTDGDKRWCFRLGENGGIVAVTE